MSYVPPHLRKKDSASPRAYHTYNRNDLAIHFGCDVNTMHTLSVSTHAPEKLSHILIHVGQNPEYPTLFVKTNLHVLPSDGIPVEGQVRGPVPLFKQVPWGSGFEFDSWVHILRVKHFEPRSVELRDMLGRKWKNKTRDEDAWKESLDVPWAEMTVEKVHPQPGAPSIGRAES